MISISLGMCLFIYFHTNNVLIDICQFIKVELLVKDSLILIIFLWGK